MKSRITAPMKAPTRRAKLKLVKPNVPYNSIENTKQQHREHEAADEGADDARALHDQTSKSAGDPANDKPGQ